MTDMEASGGGLRRDSAAPADAASERKEGINRDKGKAHPSQSFTSTFASDTTFAGNMFDIVARDNIAITSMAVNTYVDSLRVQVYTRAGSYGGFENDLSAWEYVGETTVKGRRMDTPTMIDKAFKEYGPILIRRNARQAFYITTDGPFLRSTKGTNEGEEKKSTLIIEKAADISFFQGVGKRYPMTSGTHSARIWNGMIQYRSMDDIERTASLGEVTFRRGDLAVRNARLGINVCTGMSVRVVARANRRVQLADGTTSNMRFHSMPDGAAIFPHDDGYVYVSNSEMKQGLGGVYGLYFDQYGNVVDYKLMLSGTTRNCGGGRTPWNTWITCEEYGRGQCWQIDPKNEIPPQITQLGGSGGNFESVAVDDRIEYQPIFFVTEDAEYGCLRKYTPPISYHSETGSPVPPDWDTLHAGGGTTQFLFFHGDNEFQWTTNEQAARDSQARYFPNLEGIDYHDGYLYFVSKKKLLMYVLDLDNGTYTTASTKSSVMTGKGSFRHSPDQLVQNDGDYLYATEDGGDTVGVYAIHKPTGKLFVIFEGGAKYKHDETTGLAFSADGTKMYAAFQDCGCDHSESGLDYGCGCLLEFSRDDGRSFDGSTLDLKFHSSAFEQF
eukprot:CAMPEP_0181130106 /NCGR_PEP_ID=MMETSP1071-20121207/29680_1 /TAXON_ID=35127 /ORGANISM="Thalassiosira sp., Strain NH16" /LENGTH=610 /DNA_ID=CAMNT_0023216141 /DNA_START=108 /DNA_END=1938 /DNA_ORIENTATION=+